MFRNLSQCSKHATQHHDILYLFLFSHHKPLKTISATMRLSTLLLLMSIICASCTKKDIKQPENEITLPIIANSISNQQIRAFAEDKNGHIWIGTFRGLNKFTNTSAPIIHQVCPTIRFRICYATRKAGYGFLPSTVCVFIQMKTSFSAYL